MGKVLIMRGTSGSGKSTYVTKAVAEFVSENDLRTAVVCSADHFWIDEDGNYKFVPGLLQEAHKDCFRRFIQAIDSNTNLVIVDNTNTQLHEIAPYLRYAQLFGYEIEVVRCVCDVDVAAERNVHGVPQRTVEAMKRRMENLPNYWPKEKLIRTDA